MKGMFQLYHNIRSITESYMNIDYQSSQIHVLYMLNGINFLNVVKCKSLYVA